jgi:hypothetical protein
MTQRKNSKFNKECPFGVKSEIFDFIPNASSFHCNYRVRIKDNNSNYENICCWFDKSYSIYGKELSNIRNPAK